MSKLNYNTSKDYKRLKELLDEGYEVVCIIPSEFPRGNMCAFVRREHSAVYPHRRDYVFAEFGFYIQEKDFIESCIARNIEFIEPTEEE